MGSLEAICADILAIKKEAEELLNRSLKARIAQ